MTIYQMIKKKNSNFLIDNDEEWWSLFPDKNAIIITDKKDCKINDQLYACSYNIEKQLTMEKLFKILYKELTIEETKLILNEMDWIKEMYQYYLHKKK